MTAKELLIAQIDAVTYQIEKVLENLTEEQLDKRLDPSSQTIREQVEHLCEVYTAVDTIFQGKQHSWGQYSVEDKSWGNLTTLCWTLRAKAIEWVTSSDDDKTLNRGSDFIVGHDNYHVGQIASIRIATDSTWDPFSIYKH